MSWMFNLLLVVQILSSLAIISLVLLQQGKGADMGSAFGSGSAGSLFGATGAANFMSRATKWAAVVFFISTIGLAYVANRGNTGQDTGIMQTSHKPHLLHHLPVRLFRALHLRRLLMPFLVCQVPLQFQQCQQCLQYRLHLWCPQYLLHLWYRLLPQHLLVIKGSKFKSKIVATCYNLWLIKTTQKADVVKLVDTLS